MNLINKNKPVIKEFLSGGKYLLNRPPLPSKRFVIFGRGRSGSTLLVSLLNSHEEICCDGEILHDRVSWPRLYVDLCSSRCQLPIYGFKLLSYQLRDIQPIINPKKFLFDLHLNGYKIIYLSRQNLLDHALSNINARRQNKFHHRAGEKKQKYQPISVSIEEVIHWIEHSQSLEKYEKSILKDLPHLSLTYEDHLLDSNSHQQTANIIFDFLEIPPQQISTNLVKIVPRNLQKLVENYESLTEKLKTTKYSPYLI